MIKDIIEQAIRQIELERDQRITEVKNNIMQDKIFPHNIEIDTKRDAALQSLLEKRDTEIAELNAKYEQERQSIIDASEKNKSENANMILARETYEITTEYNKVITELCKQIEIKE